jgi:hypothetical protein
MPTVDAYGSHTTDEVAERLHRCINNRYRPTPINIRTTAVGP